MIPAISKFRALGVVFGIASSFALASLGATEADFLSEDDLLDEPLDMPPSIADPLEPFNRVVFQFNDFVYGNVVEPIADTYTRVVPEPVDAGLTRFFRNLRYPVRLASNVIQLDFETARIETERFIINTTAGLGGFVDRAASIDGLERPLAQDIGHALGAYGMGEGFYVVLPIIGPSNLRDGLGVLGNRTVSPWHRPYTVLDDWEVRLGLDVSEFIHASPRVMRTYNATTRNAIDPYSSVKDGFLQSRRSQIREKRLAPANAIVRRQRP